MDSGVLTLRVGAGTTLFVKHGLEKLTGYSAMVQHFPDPIHIGAHASLAFAPLIDGICSILVIAGVLTQPASLLIVINLVTAFFLVDHATVLHHDHAELVLLYIFALAALTLAGPGPWSLDARLKM
jgi:putative oxidoreductase